jgi:hypothetical protein
MSRPYPCPHCAELILAATQPNFDQLPYDKRKRRYFEPQPSKGPALWVIIRSTIVEDGYTFTTLYYRSFRSGDDPNKLHAEHNCKGTK